MFDEFKVVYETVLFHVKGRERSINICRVDQPDRALDQRAADVMAAYDTAMSSPVSDGITPEERFSLVLSLRKLFGSGVFAGYVIEGGKDRLIISREDMYYELQVKLTLTDRLTGLKYDYVVAEEELYQSSNPIEYVERLRRLFMREHGHHYKFGLGSFLSEKPAFIDVYSGYERQAKKLQDVLPGLGHRVNCPVYGCANELGIWANRTLMDVIPHINDVHGWTREDIADWLESLEVDLTFATEVNE